MEKVDREWKNIDMKKGTRTTLIVIGVIALVFIFIAFFTETEIRIEVNSKDATPEYSTFFECNLRELQKCSPVNCYEEAEYFCKEKVIKGELEE